MPICDLIMRDFENYTIFWNCANIPHHTECKVKGEIFPPGINLDE